MHYIATMNVQRQLKTDKPRYVFPDFRLKGESEGSS